MHLIRPTLRKPRETVNGSAPSPRDAQLDTKDVNFLWWYYPVTSCGSSGPHDDVAVSTRVNSPKNEILASCRRWASHGRASHANGTAGTGGTASRTTPLQSRQAVIQARSSGIVVGEGTRHASD
jgi:hypothetical protein